LLENYGIQLKTMRQILRSTTLFIARCSNYKSLFGNPRMQLVRQSPHSVIGPHGRSVEKRGSVINGHSGSARPHSVIFEQFRSAQGRTKTFLKFTFYNNMNTQLAELPSDPNNPIVFFDIHMGGHNIGRIKMELFANIVPKTAENFRYINFYYMYVTFYFIILFYPTVHSIHCIMSMSHTHQQRKLRSYRNNINTQQHQHATTNNTNTQQHATTRSITQHHATSRNITQHHATSRNITQHHTTSHSPPQNSM
jgi:hypothetical protein